jgi:hypothetical protein
LAFAHAKLFNFTTIACFLHLGHPVGPSVWSRISRGFDLGSM